MVRIDSKYLSDYVKAVVLCSDKQQTLSILNHMVLSANGRLELMATDLEIGIKTWLDVQADVDFEVCLPGKLFQDVVNNAGGWIEITPIDNNQVKVSSASGTREITYQDAADFPEWQDVKGKTRTVKRKDFLSQIRKALASTSHDASRFNLNMILLDGDAGKVVATDGHRLAANKVNWIPKKVNAMLPYDAAKTACKVLDKFKKVHELDLIFGDKRLAINSDVFSITIRLGEGDYPDYKKIMQDKSTLKHTKVTVQVAELLAALKQVKIMTGPRNMYVDFWIDTDSLFVRSNHPDLGYGQVQVDADISGYAVADSCFQLKHVIDAVQKQRDADKLDLYLPGVGAPAYFGDELVMPCRDGNKADQTPDNMTRHDWMADLDETQWSWSWFDTDNNSPVIGQWERKG